MPGLLSSIDTSAIRWITIARVDGGWQVNVERPKHSHAYVCSTRPTIEEALADAAKTFLPDAEDDFSDLI